MEVVSLAKGQRVSLTKRSPGLNEVAIGLGWDPADRNPSGKAKGFFGRLFGSGIDEAPVQEIDCDAFAIAIDNTGHHGSENLLYFGQKSILGSTIVHSGDNLTGDGEGDDETIIAKLEEVPSRINRIVVAVNIYRGRERKQSFGKIRNAYIRIVNTKTKEEMCRYNLSDTEDYSDYVTVHFGDLVRGESGWEFEAVGKPSSAGSIGEFERTV